MFAQFRVFPITGFTDGKPTISSPIPFLANSGSESEINNISVALSPEVVTKTYKADNKEERDVVKKGYNGTVNFYGIDKTALAAISNNIADVNGNTILESSNNGNPKVVIFYQGKDEKGKKYNMWLYNCEFDEVPFDANQDDGDPKAAALNFFASAVIYNGHTIFGARVYENQTGYIAEGTEPTAAGLYMPQYTSTGGGGSQQL